MVSLLYFPSFLNYFLSLGFVQGDDTGLQRVQNLHRATASAEDNIKTWFNMGGQIQYYDYPLDQWLNVNFQTCQAMKH